MWIGYAVEAAIDAGYEPAELPEDAMSFADLWTYHGEQSNGGHAQYRGSTEGDVAAWRRASALLGRLGLGGHRALLDEFIGFSIESEERIDELYAEERHDEATELFYGFDDRFAELERAGPRLLDTLHDWLLRQPWVEIDGSEGPMTMDRLRASIPPHPAAEQRYAARMRRRAAENAGANKAIMLRLLERLRGRS